MNTSASSPPVRVPFLALSREYHAIGPLLLNAVESVFSTQNFIMGAQVAEFERAAQEKCGVAHAIGCSSGTDALWLALEGAGIGPVSYTHLDVYKRQALACSIAPSVRARRSLSTRVKGP